MKTTIDSHFWDEYAELYVQYTPNFQKKLLHDVSINAFGNVLDAGTGVGKLIPYLEKNPKVKKIIMIDSNQYMLKNAKKNIKKDKVKLIENENVLNISKYKKENVDTICSLNVIYCLKNPIEFFEKCFKILKKKGTLIISSQNRRVDLKKVEKEMEIEFGNEEKFEKFKNMQKYLVGENKNSFPTTYENEELITILKIIGFKKIKVIEGHYLHSNFLIIAKK